LTAPGVEVVDIIDISLPLDTRLAVWPGDTAFEYQLVWKRSAGAAVNVGSARMSTHCGTHVDAPFHFDEDGQKVDELSLTTFIGKTLVIHARGCQNVSRNKLSRDLQGATRVLIRTDAWGDPHSFPESIPVMDLDVPDWLRSQGIVLLGVDLPSVDALDSKDLPIHHALARNQIAILESLHLRDVEEGVYDLVAAPLKIVGGDAAPVRAVLIRRGVADTPHAGSSPTLGR
jgi:arylformamidase